MKRSLTTFLQAVIVLTGIVMLVFLIRVPLTEGRAANLDLLRIYSDPFILYGYATAIVFFVALYKAFKLLGYIGQDKAGSSAAIGALRSIRYCAIILSILIAAAGLYIKVFHNKEDDPAGFLAICIVTIVVAVIVATAASVVEKKWQKVMDKKAGIDR
ncbi:DUF2975 domain-containing protein [Niabella soli]|uniref:DUF2975 domain-containing protein n=1 Tax=Niabella soli DSM 19437 TaxID=929713 RepID=W0EVJ6_9BACT|nr:DUF2975 domain-containing protein [Niabella soli]AHF14812.1 hypothetical protein NIASO_05735 [Niabella soli DSM 19437]